jgi:hypothetical protein
MVSALEESDRVLPHCFPDAPYISEMRGVDWLSGYFSCPRRVQERGLSKLDSKDSWACEQ